MNQKLIFMDIVKGVLFFAGMYVTAGIFGGIAVLIFEKNILGIEKPLYAITGGALFLIVFGFIIAFSKVRQAGYSKNIVSEIYYQIFNSTKHKDRT